VPVPPDVTIAFSPSSARTGKDISFVATATAAGGGSITSYARDFDDDGQTDSTLKSPTLTGGSAAAGDHRVKVTVMDSNQLTASELVATGKRSYSPAGKASIKLKLTAPARKLLKKSKSLRITGEVTLTRADHAK
jgi:PKD domain